MFFERVKLSLPDVKAHGYQNWLVGVTGLTCGSTVYSDEAVIRKRHGERSSSEKENRIFRTFKICCFILLERHACNVVNLSACMGGTMASWLVRSTPERAARVRASHRASLLLGL